MKIGVSSFRSSKDSERKQRSHPRGLGEEITGRGRPIDFFTIGCTGKEMGHGKGGGGRGYSGVGIGDKHC